MQTSTPTLNPALRDFWLTPARNRVLYGGRSSSKSWDAAGFAVYLATQCNIRVLCARQFQNKIAESVYTLLKIQISRFGLTNQFVITENTIRHKVTGAEFMFYGLWRHIDEIKSLESIDICWIEEAHNLTQEQWDILEPTLRKEGSQFWIIFNPRLTTDFVYKRFVRHTPPDTIKRHINFNENPFLSQTILKVIEPKGIRRIGFDVADSGNDKCATVAAHGFLAMQVDEWKAREDELLKSAGRVHALARELDAEIDYDSIGVGAFAGAHFQALNTEHEVRIGYFRFNAGAAVLNPDAQVDQDDPKSPKNKDFYANLKAQAWWSVSKRFRNTYNAVTKGEVFDEDDLIAISSDCEHLDGLIDELSIPRKDFDNSGRSKVESKKDLEKRDVPSPNKADAFVMAFAPRDKAPSAGMFLTKRHR